jgi:hypothetical protein
MAIASEKTAMELSFQLFSSERITASSVTSQELADEKIDRLPYAYSYLNATIGSTLVARSAGR